MAHSRSDIKRVSIIYDPKNRRAAVWSKKIRSKISSAYPGVSITGKDPQAVIVLGGDGTILDAARRYHENGAVILGLNLGNVGFLASVRNERNFLPALKKFLKGQYTKIERMVILAEVKRKNKIVFTAEALNEIVVKNPLGMVELQARVAGHLVKNTRGTGLMVATATGSTAYNLSAHGPIVMPDIKCLIITDILGHSIPSPSVIVKYTNPVSVKVFSFRKSGILSLVKNRQNADVLLAADGSLTFPLEEKDEIIIRSSPHLVKFAEIEKNYFFKSLKEKFGFK